MANQYQMGAENIIYQALRQYRERIEHEARRIAVEREGHVNATISQMDVYDALRRLK